MSTLRVLYVSHTHVIGGGERSLLELLSHLPDSVEPIVATPAGPLSEAVLGLGIPVVDIPLADVSLRLHPVHTSRGVAGLAAAGTGVRRALRRTRADLLHANSIRAGLVAAPRAVRGTVPAVVSVRDRLPATPAARITLEVLERSGALLIANSAWTREGLRHAAARSSALVMYPPVDLERFDPARAPSREVARHALGLEPDGFVVAVVGQLTPWKGQDLAIRAVARLAEEDVTLLVVGEVTFDGPNTRLDNSAFEREIRTLAAELGVASQVRFLGHRDDVEAVLAAVDVLALPSRDEPFGRVVPEALAMGVPVLATTRGGPAEVVRSDLEGYLLEPSDLDAWALALARLRESPELVARLGAAGIERAREYDVTAHAARTVTVYEALAPSEVRRRRFLRRAADEHAAETRR
jgi:glycosyltransferase involved in cell wall biosynthesis